MKFLTPTFQIVEIDDADAELVGRYSWHTKKSGKTCYVRTSIKGKNISLHRFLMGAKPGEQVDHKDMNGLNNRRENLRLCTGMQNCANKPKTRGAESRFKGVYWIKSANAWVARLLSKDARQYLGMYSTEEDAALAYDRAAEARYGEFARLNIPESRRVPVRITRKNRKSGAVLSPSTPNFCRSAG